MDIKKDLKDFETHCAHSDQLQVAELAYIARRRIEALEAMLADSLEIIKNGIAHNYSGDPKENRRYTSVVNLLSNKDKDH